jgi:glycosyltransferase involved in cell wall biosynthesis
LSTQQVSEYVSAQTMKTDSETKVCVLVNWNTSDYDGQRPYSFFQFWPEKNLKTIVYGTSSSKIINFVEKKILRFNLWPIVRGWRDARNSDLLFCYGSQAGLPAAFWKAFRGQHKPRLVVIDIENLTRKSRGPLGWVTEFAAKSIDDLICFASFQQEQYHSIRSLHAARKTFIPLGYPGHLLPKPAAVANDGSIVAVGYLGTRFRDWPTLAAAYCKFRAANSSGPLVIVGRQLERRLARRFPTGHLVCHPYVPLQRFAELVAPASMCVVPLPDRPLSFGQGTVLTLMGLRKLVITADVPGIRDYISDGQTGFLYEAGNSDSLAAVLQKVWQLTPAAIAKVEHAAYRAAHTEFSEPVMTRRIYDFLYANGQAGAVRG